MVYMGSKARFAKELLPILLHGRRPGQYYIEPFCGGCNMIDKVPGPRIASDSNHYLIALFQYLQGDGKLPEKVSFEEYHAVKANKDNYPDWYVAFVGFTYSFRGKWFGGYGKSEIGKHQALSQVNNLIRQAPLLRGIEFHSGSYLSLSRFHRIVSFTAIRHTPEQPGTKTNSTILLFGIGAVGWPLPAIGFMYLSIMPQTISFACGRRGLKRVSVIWQNPALKNFLCIKTAFI